MVAALKDQLYPLSTEDAKSIPLDVIRPISLIKKSFLGAGVAGVLVIPTGWKIATFFSLSGCLIQFAQGTIPNPPVDGTPYEDTLLVPPNCIVTSTVIEGNARIISLDNLTAGSVIAQQIQKWAGMALSRQSTKI